MPSQAGKKLNSFLVLTSNFEKLALSISGGASFKWLLIIH